MITPELRQFVAQAMAAGQPVDAIREQLKSQGWESLDVEHALSEAGRTPKPPYRAIAAAGGSTGELPGFVYLLTRSWHILWSNRRSFFGFLVVGVVIGIALAIALVIVGAIGGASLLGLSSGGTTGVGVGVIILAIVLILTAVASHSWMGASLLVAVRDASRSGALRVWGSYREGFRYLLPYLWLTILIGIVCIGGTVLFIIPGIVLSVLFSLPLYALVDQGSRGFTAMGVSRELVRGVWVPVFLRLLGVAVVAFLVYIIGLALLSVGLSSDTSLIAFLFTLLHTVFFASVYFFVQIFGFELYLSLRKNRGELAQVKKPFVPISIGAFGFVALIAGVVFLSGPISEQLRSSGVFEASEGLEQADIDSLELSTFSRAFEFAAVRAAVEMYHDESGSYPATLNDLDSSMVNRDAVDFSSFDYRSTGATYELCTQIGGEQVCEGPATSTASTASQ